MILPRAGRTGTAAIAMTPASNMPDWLDPMAATLTQERFGGRDWSFERKFDGIRLLADNRGDGDDTRVEHARLARPDGRHAHEGAVRRKRLVVRAEVRRHPAARVQARRRCPVVFAQSPAAASAGAGESDRGPSRRRGDSR